MASNYMCYDNNQIDRIITNVKIFNHTIDNEDVDLLKYTIEAVIDRVLLYLKHDKLSLQFEKIVADLVSSIFIKYKKNINNKDVDMNIVSVSDNGQSITYANEIKNYLATSSDNELLGGFTNLLSRYRRIKVVTSK